MAPGRRADVISGEFLTRDRNGAPAASYLEIQERDRGTLSIVPLSSGRELLGRDPHLKISLADTSISNLHAALVRDPYDRWWIHDLGSTNGTYVNGTRVALRLVDTNDTIEVGRYRLTIRRESQFNQRPTAPPPPPPSSRGSGAPVTARSQCPTPERLDTVLALEAIESARSLLLFEDRHLRLNALCESSVSERFPGTWSAVVRVNRVGPSTLISGPLTRAGGPAREDQTQRLLSSCEARRHELLGSSRAQVLSLRDGSRDPLIGSAIATFPDGAEMLFVQLPHEIDPEEWRSLYSLLAASFRYASELWDTRGQFGFNAAIERELEMARQLQESLIPRLPVMPGLDLAIGYEPSRWVGGDYADAVHMADGRVLLTVADACGKGLQAALVASSLHTLVHVLGESGSVADMARRMNSYLCSCLPQHSFVTMVAIAVDTARRELECVNLGHPPPLLVAANGTVRALQSRHNVALGMMDFVPQVERGELAPDETVFLYTDGLLDPDYEERDQSRLPGQLAACVPLIASMADAPVERVCDTLSRHIGATRGPMNDDAAFLLARLRAGAGPEVSQVHSSTVRRRA